MVLPSRDQAVGFSLIPSAKAVLRTTDLYLGEWGEPPDNRTIIILKITGEIPSE